MSSLLTADAVGRPGATAPSAATSTGGRGWAWAGAAAGALALVAFLTSSSLAPSDDALMADNALLAEHVIDEESVIWVFQVLSSLAALAVAVFAAGLRRKLAEQAPAGSLLPTLAGAGLASVALMLLVGGGISTELFWHLLQDYGKSDPDTIVANLAIFNTMAWVWAGAGLTAGAVAVAALRHGSLPRWMGWVSALVAGLIAVTQLVPLQYMAAFAGAPWLVVIGVGLARSERSA